MWHFFMRFRRFFIAACHVVIIVFSLMIAFMLRFEFSIPKTELALLAAGLWIVLAAKLPVFWFARFDRGWWRFVGIADLYNVLIGNILASVLFSAISIFWFGFRFPRSVYIIDFLLCFLTTAGLRFSVRLYYESVARELSKEGNKGLLIYGAGAAGVTLLREIRSNPSLKYRIVGFLDDSSTKRHAVVMGVSVLGSGREASLIVDRHKGTASSIDEIVIAMPSADGSQMREALANCRAAGVPCKTVPGVAELLSGKILSSQIRDVSVVDLLGREPVLLDESMIRSSIQGRAVMVTGAAGSIGSELCRQVARFHPKKLIALDQAESELFRIEMELTGRFPDLNLVSQIGDIRNYGRLEETIRRYAVDSIFHAAAYKHVPLMESHLFEAMSNNVLGTRNLVYAAGRNGVSDFLMISSDKAVNPTNVMGTTKRVAELIVSSMPLPKDGGRTKFVSVRFGNVLGSNGSVIPVFKQQIAAGGPVTVTHPQMRRYFMTIPEAVQLVLQASTMSKGSEIFVLDMGEPVYIVDLAKNMIRLSGKVPDVDIEIRYTGLRPGEKLFEELITEGENILPTYHQKIKIFRGTPLPHEIIEARLNEIETAVNARDETAVLLCLKDLVPEYQPSEHWLEVLHGKRPPQSATLLTRQPKIRKQYGHIAS